MKENYERSQLIFVLFPSVIGLLVCLMIRGMKHDMKNYIADMEALMREETKDSSALRQYLDSLQTSDEQLDMKYNTGNPVTDVILQRYVQLAKGSGITFDADFIFPSDMNMDAFDLSIILNNALNNALEACQKSKRRQTAHDKARCFQTWHGASEY